MGSKKIVNFEADEALKGRLKELADYYGLSQAATIRKLIEANHRVIQGADNSRRIEAGSLSFDMEFGEKIAELVEGRVPNLEDRTKALERELRDLWLKVSRLEKKEG